MHKPFVVPTELEKKLIARRGKLHAYESIDPKKTALVVVDMQNFFMADGELMAANGSSDIVPNVNRLASAVREAGGVVVWIQAVAEAPGTDGWEPFHALFHEKAQGRRLGSMNINGEGFKLWPDMEVKSEDERVIKKRYSAFIQGASNIEEVLHRHGTEMVLITGVATNVCCDSTGRDCMMRGFRTIMVSDGNASFTEDEHQAALLSFITYFGDVQTTDEVIGRLKVPEKREAAVV
ncbi:MAG: cysteine hydrolase [Betaproteobacteria bacterium]|nr:cysteine hydrolase [Betaproteobacteria bacterium]